MSTRIRRRRIRKKRTKKFNHRMVVGLFFILVSVFLLFSALMINICRLNKNKGDTYKKKVLAQQSYTNAVLNYRRGAIKDRNDTILAQSVRKFNLIIEARKLATQEDIRKETLTQIAAYFAFDTSVIEKIIEENPNSMYQHVEGLKELTSQQIQGFKKEMKTNDKVKGVWFEETYTRNYPLNEIACNIVGFTSSEEQGTYGVEGSYNEVLNGKTGREYGYFDANMDFQRTVKKATNGNNVVLTIDANVQRLIEKQIKKYNEDVGAKNISVMVMNPNNGEILAMASKNSYNLNEPRELTSMYTQEQIQAMDEKTKSEALMSMWSNFCISSAYEPGSTFKPFTVAAALDEGVVKDSDYFPCDGGLTVSGVRIRCSNRSGHGSISLQTSLMESCNSALMAIGEKLGRANFSKYNQIFGFGQKTGIDLPGETAGLIHKEDELNPVELATSSFGQTQTVTMVQMAAGFSSLVNGGDYYEPHIVKEVQNENGAIVKKVEPTVVKKTVSEKTSKLIRKYMKATVEDGTAAPAGVKGYSIGGKTGTAQKRPVTERKYLVSFLGCVPAENPEAVVYVIIDEPNVEDQAHSTYATEFASKIMKKILPFLGIYADQSQEETTAESGNEKKETEGESAGNTDNADGEDNADSEGNAGDEQ
ncbi:MAG: penicillin-binding transpeptidase domain-containing protein [Clostridiales bacterium]|nr:penicillin-binding transpeptidase domain-containing protein [Clostridiales bacterium]